MDEAILGFALSTVTLATCFLASEDLKKKKKVKRKWVRPWLARKDRSVYTTLVRELSLEDSCGFFDFHRMHINNFQDLLQLVGPQIMKQDTKLRNAISPAQRLSVTLRYLATGETRRSLAFQYRMSHNLISSIIPEVCSAIYRALRDTYLKMPRTTEEWQQVASKFNFSWNFPMCIGAIGGKHFLVTKPPNTGSDYKTNASIIMLALVDAEYKFMYVDVGAQGRVSDCNVWDRSNLRAYLEGNKLGVPPPSALPFCTVKSPYVIVGDDAFPLKTYLMKPFPGKNLTADQQIFNYRLSRAKRVSENAFGILAAKFRVFRSAIKLKPEHVNKLIFASVVLHNYLRDDCRASDTQLIDWDEDDVPVGIFQELPEEARGHSNDAEAVRETMKNYFVTIGKIPGQERNVLLY